MKKPLPPPSPSEMMIAEAAKCVRTIGRIRKLLNDRLDGISRQIRDAKRAGTPLPEGVMASWTEEMTEIVSVLTNTIDRTVRAGTGKNAPAGPEATAEEVMEEMLKGKRNV